MPRKLKCLDCNFYVLYAPLNIYFSSCQTLRFYSDSDWAKLAFLGRLPKLAARRSFAFLTSIFWPFFGGDKLAITKVACRGRLHWLKKLIRLYLRLRENNPTSRLMNYLSPNELKVFIPSVIQPDAHSENPRLDSSTRDPSEGAFRFGEGFALVSQFYCQFLAYIQDTSRHRTQNE